MKIIKRIVLILLIIIALPFIIALFVPKTCSIRVSETINRPSQEIFDYVRILDNQRYYSAWVLQDPNLIPTITGTDGTVGATQHWDSEKVGTGQQTITAISPTRIDLEIKFIKPMEGTAQTAFAFNPLSETETEVSTEFFTESPYPFNFLSFFIGKKAIEKASKETLQNLKRNLE